MPTALRIAIVGAESTGKSTLAVALADALARSGPWRVALVDEWLREWCERAGRTPASDEQRAIAAEQHRRIDAAAVDHDIVVCDTTAAMTAIYSRLLFDDRSLDDAACAWHRASAITLLTAIDLPWQADGLQRDGPHVREPVDAALRTWLRERDLPFSVIGGRGGDRLLQARAAVAPLLRGRTSTRAALAADAVPAPDQDEAAGEDDGAPATGNAPRWRCECCATARHDRLLRLGAR